MGDGLKLSYNLGTLYQYIINVLSSLQHLKRIQRDAYILTYARQLRFGGEVSQITKTI